ncbi:MAG: hypothetical protein ACK4K4_01435 [Caldimicrobium sp.]
MEENKKDELTQASQDQPQEQISSEKTEELIKELLEQEKEGLDKQPIESKQFNFKKLLFLISLLFLVLIFLLGIFVLSSLFQGNKKETNLPSKGSIEEKKVEEEKGAKVVAGASQVKREIVFNTTSLAKPFPFKLELPNFLFALDEKTFLKIDIYLYFERAEDYKKAYANRVFLREFFLNEINNKKDPIFWKDVEKIRAYEEHLLETMKKGSFSFSPDKIELEGVLLKV